MGLGCGSVRAAVAQKVTLAVCTVIAPQAWLLVRAGRVRDVQHSAACLIREFSGHVDWLTAGLAVPSDTAGC